MNRLYTYTIHLLFVSLACAWLVHFAFPVYYSVCTIEIKNRQHASIAEKDGEFEVKRLSLHDYKKLKYGDDELLIDGKMYDIADVEYEGDYVKCTVLKDNDETELNQSLVQDVDHSLKKEQHCKQIAFWCPVATPPATGYHPFLYTSTIINSYYILSEPILNGFMNSIIRPPELG